MVTRRDFLKLSLSGLGALAFGSCTADSRKVDVSYVEAHGFKFIGKGHLTKMAKEFGTDSPKRFMNIAGIAMDLEDGAPVKVFNNGLYELVEDNSVSIMGCESGNPTIYQGVVFSEDEVADTLEEENIPYGQIITDDGEQRVVYSFIKSEHRQFLGEAIERRLPKRRATMDSVSRDSQLYETCRD
jgi:hypothetical protein